jgi:hypothetical protein
MLSKSVNEAYSLADIVNFMTINDHTHCKEKDEVVAEIWLGNP